MEGKAGKADVNVHEFRNVDLRATRIGLSHEVAMARGCDPMNDGRRRAWWAIAVLAGIAATAVLLRRSARPGAGAWRRYGLVYRFAYRVGFKPWDRGVVAPDLVEIVDGPTPSPPGRALDLGCGTGTNSIYLAKHGWDVTGVDMVPTALAIARRRAGQARVSPRFVEGDVTRLRDLGVGDGYTLLLDVGCFHAIPEDRRPAYVEGVSRVAAPGATFLLFGFARSARFAPLAAGVTPEEVRTRFDEWDLVDAGRLAAEALGPGARPRLARWLEVWRYRLRRLPERSPD